MHIYGSQVFALTPTPSVMDAFFAVKEVLLTDQGRAGPGSKALINFNRLEG